MFICSDVLGELWLSRKSQVPFFVSSETVSYPDGTRRKFEDTEVAVLSLEDTRGRFFMPKFLGDHFFLTTSW